MKILEIIPQLSSGGGERFVVDLCNNLACTNDVVLVVLHPLDKGGFYLNDVSAKVRVISLNKKTGLDSGLAYRVYKLIRQERPDIVHTHLRAILYLPLSLLFYSKARYYHTVHNDAEKEAGDTISTMLRKCLFKLKIVTAITISKESHRSFVAFYNMDTPMINNGRDIPADLTVTDDVQEEFRTYRRTAETKVLVNLARIDPVKRQDMLAKVVLHLWKEGYDFSMLLIGSTKKTEMVNKIKSYNCPCLYVLGEKKNPLEYLKLCDAYCLCSSYEGMPISLIEALGTGCIPVCTPVGGIIDVVKDGENGLLSETLEEQSYYDALKKFLEYDAQSVAKLRANAIDSYRPYSMTECAKNYMKLFQSGL